MRATEPDREDAVILFNRPDQNYEAPVIEFLKKKELQTALSLRLPIVWIRIGPEAGRVPLTMLPSSVSHFSFPDLDPASGQFTAESVDAIVQKAFDIHHRDYVDRLLDELAASPRRDWDKATT